MNPLDKTEKETIGSTGSALSEVFSDMGVKVDQSDIDRLSRNSGVIIALSEIQTSDRIIDMFDQTLGNPNTPPDARQGFTDLKNTAVAKRERAKSQLRTILMQGKNQVTQKGTGRYGTDRSIPKKTEGSFLTNLSSYYLAFERLMFTAIGLLFVGYLAFSNLPGLFAKTLAFIVLVVAAFYLSELANFFARGKKIEPTGKDLKILADIRQMGGISKEEKDELVKKYLSGDQKRNALAFSLLLWCLLTEMLFAYGLGDSLVRFSVVQETLNIIPASVESNRVSAHDIYLTKLFYVVSTITLLIKFYSGFVLVFPFVRKSDVVAAIRNHGQIKHNRHFLRLLGTLLFFGLAGFFIYISIFIVANERTLSYAISDVFLIHRNLFVYGIVGFSVIFVKLLENWIVVFKNLRS